MGSSCVEDPARVPNRHCRRQAPFPIQIVELRFFGGLTFEEVAEALGIGLTTTKGEWAIARAWLTRELSACEDL